MPVMGMSLPPTIPSLELISRLVAQLLVKTQVAPIIVGIPSAVKAVVPEVAVSIVSTFGRVITVSIAGPVSIVIFYPSIAVAIVNIGWTEVYRAVAVPAMCVGRGCC